MTTDVNIRQPPFLGPPQITLGTDPDTNACQNSTSPICFNTAVSGQNIITGLWFNAIIGIVMLGLFIAWRGTFSFYQARLVSALLVWIFVNRTGESYPRGALAGNGRPGRLPVGRAALAALLGCFCAAHSDPTRRQSFHTHSRTHAHSSSRPPTPTHQDSPHVTRKPPRMKLTGHHRIWSWLVPVFTISDEELVRSAGLDALVGPWVEGTCGEVLGVGAGGAGLELRAAWCSQAWQEAHNAGDPLAQFLPPPSPSNLIACRSRRASSALA